MKIEKITKITPSERVPRLHWKWIGRDEPRETKKEDLSTNEDPETQSGKLVLYNRWGRKVVKDIQNYEYTKV